MLLHSLYMGRVVTNSQNTAVNIRIQSLDTAIHNLREAGNITDIGNRNTCLLQSLHGAAGRNDFHTCSMQLLSQLYHTCLVGYTD